MPDILRKIPWLDGLLILGILLVSAGIGSTFRSKPAFPYSSVKGSSTTTASKPTQNPPVLVPIQVDIAGAVLKPGVYSLSSGSRIQNVLILAGGLSANANRLWVAQNLNQAQILVDQQKIYIPSQNESPSSYSNKTSTNNQVGTSSSSTKPSLNHSSLEELVAVNGIGPATAKAIIDYRNQNGDFKSLEDLMKIPNIGAKTFAKLAPQLSL